MPLAWPTGWSCTRPTNPRHRRSGRRSLDDVAPQPRRHDLLVEGDRAVAIALSIAAATAGDLVLIRRKGYEDYQILGTDQDPFETTARDSAAGLAQRLACMRSG